MVSMLLAIWHIIVEVFVFWREKLLQWYRRRTPVDEWLAALRRAPTYEDWEEAALRLDALLGLDAWRHSPASRYYDWRLIASRLDALVAARGGDDVQGLVNLLRSGLVRNLGNITAPRLYNRSFAGTKLLIEDYIAAVAEAIRDVAALPPPGPAGGGGGALPASYDYLGGDGAGRTGGGGGQHVHFGTEANGGDSSTANAGGSDADSASASASASPSPPPPPPPPTMTNQAKLDFVHDTRQAFGRSTLVLQGGAIFGLVHLGVVKALFLRGLLPRIITGTATGALIAALVAIHTEEELPRVLSGEGIDLSAFAGRGPGAQRAEKGGGGEPLRTRLQTLLRRVRRFGREGYFLDVKVLEECVRANVGDLTFEEAFARSKRVLNITVATAGRGGVPTLLNYLTAPNVLIWTAAVASNASSPSLYGDRETRLLCKDAAGAVVPWAPASMTDFRHWSHASYSDRDSPLLRIAELFNVNHFIVSQARPYLIPFLQSDVHGPSLLETRNKAAAATAFLGRMVGLEVRHRLRQLDTLQLLPVGIRRFLVDDVVPGPSVTLVPEVTAGDFVRLLETPTRQMLAYWILRGERSVWPAVAALRVRCAVETELDRAYQGARRLKAGGLRRRASSSAAVGGGGGVAAATTLGEGRERASSTGAGY